MQNKYLDYLAVIPGWFALIGVTIYGSGFLVIFTFLNRFGLRNYGDFFKIKYIHAGLIYCSLLIILIIPILCYVLTRDRLNGIINNYVKNYSEDDLINNIDYKECINFRTALFINYSIIFLWLFLSYISFFLSPPKLLRTHPSLFFIYFLPIVSMTLLREIRRGLNKLRIFSHTDITIWDYRARQFLLLALFIIIAFFFFYYRIIFIRLGIMLKNGGIFFFLFTFVLGLYIYRFYKRGLDFTDTYIRCYLYILGVCFLSIIYFFNIIAFAVFIYPYIPVEKGGGDYSCSPTVEIYFKLDKLPPEVTAINEIDFKYPKLLKIIEETNDFLIVSDSTDCGKWDEKPPKIIEINRKLISRIVHLD